MGGGWGEVGERSVVFPLGVQSRQPAVVLCIFQTHLNGPGLGGAPAGGRKRGCMGGGLNTSCFTQKIVCIVETWPVEEETR